MKRPMHFVAALLAVLVSLSACAYENDVLENTVLRHVANQLPEGTSRGRVEGQLKRVSLSVDGDGLITVDADGPKPSNGAVLYSVIFDGYQLGLKSVDGARSVFGFNLDSGSHSNLSSSSTYVARTVSFGVPSAEVPDRTVPFEWMGTLSINGTDLAQTGPVTH